jgi:hypothetical protein
MVSTYSKAFATLFGPRASKDTEALDELFLQNAGTWQRSNEVL